MKKIVFASMLMLFALTMKADYADLFFIEESVVIEKMDDLNALQCFVEKNDGVTLSDLKIENNPLVLNILTTDESEFSLVSMLKNSSTPKVEGDTTTFICCTIGCVSTIVFFIIIDGLPDLGSISIGF